MCLFMTTDLKCLVREGESGKGRLRTPDEVGTVLGISITASTVKSETLITRALIFAFTFYKEE